VAHPIRARAPFRKHLRNFRLVIGCMRGLLGRMGYLGRAESLVEAELLPAGDEPALVNCRPLAEGEPLRPDEQTFKLLAPQLPADYAAWRTGRAPAAGARLSAKERKAQPPDDLFAALHLDTDDWRGAGWSQPPGSRWLEYVRPATPFKLAAPPARHVRRSRTVDLPTIARFEIQTPVRESVTKALSLGERFHVALCARSDGAPVFAGTRDGQPLTGHQHSHYFPECDVRGLLTHVTVFAPMGFDEQAVRALRSIDATWSRKSPGLKLLLIGIGTQEEFRDLPIFAESTIWESATPFVPVRHIQTSRNGKPRVDAENGLIRGSPEHDLRRLLIKHDHPAPINIERLDALDLPGRRIRWANFQRERRGGEGTANVTHSGFGFRLHFPGPIRGPFTLGYASHFGLGLFVSRVE
jgi:CRISPR-associated protein Csb2